MVAITFNIDKQKVLGEVGKTTAYVGAHTAKGDALNYESISTTDENSEMLERFWTESEAAVCDAFKGYIKDTEEGREDRFSVTLILSETFQPHLRYSIEDSLFSFFVLNITAKWFGITNKQEVEGYGAAAKDALDGARDMALYKGAPERPTYE